MGLCGKHSAMDDACKHRVLQHIELEGVSSNCVSNSVSLPSVITNLSLNIKFNTSTSFAGFKSYGRAHCGPLAKFSCIVGANGAGKSVLVSLLRGNPSFRANQGIFL